jgi:hypothetical protein
LTPGLTIAHPEMANLPDIFVARKILSTKYQPYVSGKIFQAVQLAISI